MGSHKQIIIAISLFATILMVGTTGYAVLEEYPVLDAFYMTVITITTVGFGEIIPLSSAGRLFTSFLILSGFCCLAFVSHSLIESIVNSVWRKSSEKKKMQKHIEQLHDHFILCGYGRVGEVAADHFNKAGVPIVIIEGSPDLCASLQEQGHLYIEGDATSEEAMMKAGIKKAKGLLALLGSDPDNLFVVLSARELNPTLTILSRAEKATSEHKILQGGADSVISPFTSAGQHIADSMLLATGHASLLTQASPHEQIEPQWIDVKNGSSMVGQTIEQLSTDIGRKIIGMRRAEQDTIDPSPKLTIKEGDHLLVLDSASPADQRQIHQPKENKKIVIIDDNPVIVRLYVRLFQKAGFSPSTATDGEQGIALIVKEQPAAAVIDYQLPLLSGVEVCQAIRANDQCAQDMQLILFTAHTDSAIHRQALEAGANAVIVKSQNASEIIESVISHLRGDKR